MLGNLDSTQKKGPRTVLLDFDGLFTKNRERATTAPTQDGLNNPEQLREFLRFAKQKECNVFIVSNNGTLKVIEDTLNVLFEGTGISYKTRIDGIDYGSINGDQSKHNRIYSLIEQGYVDSQHYLPITQNLIPQPGEAIYIDDQEKYDPNNYLNDHSLKPKITFIYAENELWFNKAKNVLDCSRLEDKIPILNLMSNKSLRARSGFFLKKLQDDDKQGSKENVEDKDKSEFQIKVETKLGQNNS